MFAALLALAAVLGALAAYSCNPAAHGLAAITMCFYFLFSDP